MSIIFVVIYILSILTGFRVLWCFVSDISRLVEFGVYRYNLYYITMYLYAITIRSRRRTSTYTWNEKRVSFETVTRSNYEAWRDLIRMYMKFMLHADYRMKIMFIGGCNWDEIAQANYCEIQT